MAERRAPYSIDELIAIKRNGVSTAEFERFVHESLRAETAPLYNIPPENRQYFPNAEDIERVFSVYLRGAGPEANPRLAALRDQLLASGLVETAYIKPGVELAAVAPAAQLAVSSDEDSPNAGIILASAPGPAGGPSPDLEPEQGYRDPAGDGGVDAEYAWNKLQGELPVGRGGNTHIVDIEWAFRESHEAFRDKGGNATIPAAKPVIDDIYLQSHGTASLGILKGQHTNGEGILGLCPDAGVELLVIAPDQGKPLSTVITDAANLLFRLRCRSAGVILLEVQRAGPLPAPSSDEDSPDGVAKRYLPVEWWLEDWQAIKYASNIGVTVVEPAGNGGEWLNDEYYASHQGSPVSPAGFDPLNARPGSRWDSGAVMVGAGAPPRGTGGEDWGPARRRLPFSNYGTRVNVQAWGRGVTTAGYGDRQGGVDPDRWYTGHFSGTSSAAAIVAGVVACLQGARLAAGAALTPDQVRAALSDPYRGLRQLPWMQQGSIKHATGYTDQWIGPQPDLKKLLP